MKSLFNYSIVDTSLDSFDRTWPIRFPNGILLFRMALLAEGIELPLFYLMDKHVQNQIDKNMASLKKSAWILFWIGTMLFSSCQHDNVSIYPHHRVLQLGDNMDWANPDYDDSDWDREGSTPEIGQFWVRFHISFDERIEQLNHKGIQMISLGSYQAYWDGVLIHENGKVSNNRDNEVEGQFISQMLIPDSLCQFGEHVLALRLSNYHNNARSPWSWNTFKVEEFHHSVKEGLQLTAIMFVLGGCFLLVSLYYCLLYFKEKRDLPTLLFSVICLLFFTLLLLEYLKFFWSYPYSFHDVRLLVIGYLTASITFIVPLFLCIHLRIPSRRIFLPILLALILLVVLFINVKNDIATQLLSRIMLYSSIVLTAYAFWLRRKGSVLLLFAFIIVALINYFSSYSFDFMLFSYDINLFLSFLILVLIMLYSLSIHRQKQREVYEASILRSERLKNELLRKNIQPHFIMNTLTSIMEWVDRSPKKSIEFIEALADEFDLLNNMADKKLVPIKQEIDLCKKHLEIMTFRKEVAYIWEDENIDLSEQIPPAIIHTVVENGITHSKVPDNGQVKFKLIQSNHNNVVKYKVEVTADNRKTKSSGSGTGFKYIRSRLTESYGDRWTLSSAKSAAGWTTIISIDKS